MSFEEELAETVAQLDIVNPRIEAKARHVAALGSTRTINLEAVARHLTPDEMLTMLKQQLADSQAIETSVDELIFFMDRMAARLDNASDKAKQRAG